MKHGAAKKDDILQLCVNSNARRLVNGLIECGCSFHFNFVPENLFINRFNGQGMMNKAFGECAFTWILEANGVRGRRKCHGHLGGLGSRNPRILLPGEDLDDYSDYFLSGREVGSHLPLTFILRSKPDKWEIQHVRDYGVTIDVPGLPEHWTKY